MKTQRSWLPWTNTNDFRLKNHTEVVDILRCLNATAAVMVDVNTIPITNARIYDNKLIYDYKYIVQPTMYAYIKADWDFFFNLWVKLSNRDNLMQILLQNDICVKVRSPLKLKGLLTLSQNGTFYLN